MSWQFLILITIIVYSTSNLFHRILMKDEQSDPFAQSVAFFGLAGTFALIFSLFHGGFHYQLTLNQGLLLIPLTFFATVGPVLFFKSFQLMDASENTILQSSQKLWMVLGAFLFLGEAFSLPKILGTLIVMIGISIAVWKNKKVQLNQGIALVLIATFFYAGMDLISYYLVRNFDPISFTVFVCYLPVFSILIIRPKTLKKLRFYCKPRYAVFVSLLAICDTVGTLATFYAYQIGRNVAQIAPLMGLITISSVLLAVIFLKERDHLRNKIIGALIVMAGVLLVL